MQSSSPKARGPLALLAAFAPLEDPRVVNRTDHPLRNVLAIALVGVLCGAKGWDDLHEIGVDRRDWFARFLDLTHGIPSADTFQRVFRALRPEAFVACVTAWVASLAGGVAGEVVAFDGKTVRGALRRNPWATTLHHVHVWATRQRLLLAQAAVAGAPEETDAVRQLLALVDLEGAVATGDALHCSTPTAQAIRDAGADYALHLKANRAVLYGAVETFFTRGFDAGFGAVPVRMHRTEATAHGRHEVREGWSVPARALDLAGVCDLPDLRSVTAIARTRTIDGVTTRQVHFYVSSLPPRVKRLMAVARASTGASRTTCTGCSTSSSARTGVRSTTRPPRRTSRRYAASRSCCCSATRR